MAVDRKQQMKEITERLEQGVKDIFTLIILLWPVPTYVLNFTIIKIYSSSVFDRSGRRKVGTHGPLYCRIVDTLETQHPT